MEVLAPVTFSKNEIYRIVKNVNACIVWGGGVDIAPADDVLIKVEEPLMFESFDKILVSIMAKKIAFGSTHVVIDLPYGKHVKAHTEEDAHIIKEKFEKLADRFHIRIKILVHKTEEPAGRGIGPLLEAREAMKVLEQLPDRPLDLEQRALRLASELLTLCLEDSPEKMRANVKKDFGTVEKWATHILSSGLAHKKMKEIIKEQGGNPDISSVQLLPADFHFNIIADKNGIVSKMDSKNISIIAKILGCPTDKKAGIYLHKKIGEIVHSGEIVYTLYTNNRDKLKEAKDSLESFPILTYEA
jgi:AMP phosphorylase